MNTLYQRRSRIKEQLVGSEMMLFDKATDDVHVLKGSAAFIWKCLKTPTTPEQIATRLRDEYGPSAVPDVPAVIADVLADFGKKKLIKPRTRARV